MSPTLVMRVKIEVTNVLKRSKSSAFVGIKVGDQLDLSCAVCEAGHNGRNTYATYICIRNERTNNESFASFNQIGKLLSTIEYKEI